MSSTTDGQRVQRARVYSIRVPATGLSGRHVKFTNYLLRLDVNTPDGEILALGECQPRSRNTGDSGSRSWEFLLAVAAELEGVSLDFTDKATAVTWVRQQRARFASLAVQMQPEPQEPGSNGRDNGTGRRLLQSRRRREQWLPFRGVLFGVETALLDAAAQFLGITLAELLGAVNTASGPAVDRLDIGSVKGDPMTLLTQAAQQTPAETPLWLNLRTRLTPPQAEVLVNEVVDGIEKGNLHPPIILEQPFGVAHREHLLALQKVVNNKLEPGAVRIMTGGQSVWNVAALRRVMKKRQAGALHIQPASAGGLLSSIELARTALKADPQTVLALSLHDGASDIAQRALTALSTAMPSPGRVIQRNGDDNQLSFLKASESPEATTGGDLLGPPVTLDYDSLITSTTEFATFPPLPVADNRGYPINTFSDTGYLMPLGKNGTKGHLLEREALARGLSTTRYSKGVFTASDRDSGSIGFRWSRSDLTSAAAHAICVHKESTRTLLEAASVPVPHGRTFRKGDHSTARAFAQAIGFPVVVKPATGMKGIGVTSNIQDQDEFTAALVLLENSPMRHDDFIVEQHAVGNDYRIVVVGDEVVAAIIREPASVTGDGVHTIAELMMERNRVRRSNPHLWTRPLEYDEAAQYQLKRAGYTLDTVPSPGARVQIANSSSLSQGGESIDVTDELHPSVKEACVQAVKAIPGLFFCGVDFLLKDHTLPLSPDNGKIIELNAIPAVGNCEYPFFGKPRQVAARLIDAAVQKFELTAPDERTDSLAVRLRVRGKVTGVGYRTWLKKHADRFGVTGWVRNVDDRTVEARLFGTTEAVSALGTLAIFGPSRSLPTSVRTTHVAAREFQGFKLRPDRRNEVNGAS